MNPCELIVALFEIAISTFLIMRLIVPPVRLYEILPVLDRSIGEAIQIPDFCPVLESCGSSMVLSTGGGAPPPT